jgi:hypothetical protein
MLSNEFKINEIKKCIYIKNISEGYTLYIFIWMTCLFLKRMIT